MRMFESPSALERYGRRAWEFQRTFQTPLTDLARFVDVIMSALPGTESALVVFDQIIFEPSRELVPLYAKYSLPQKWCGDGVTIEAQGATEVRELLQAVLSEWIDFLLVPTPERFVIYADHDEYITFLADRKEQLSSVVEVLCAAKFRAVEYVRELRERRIVADAHSARLRLRETEVMPSADWPFDQAPNAAAVTTRQVLVDRLPVLRVTHYSDDHDWAFVCGTTDAAEDERVIAMEEALELDPTLRTIADLPPGWTAWREHVGSEWHRFQNEEA